MPSRPFGILKSCHEVAIASPLPHTLTGNGTVDEAAKKLDLKKQTDYIDGMKISLMAHQLMGVVSDSAALPSR